MHSLSIPSGMSRRHFIQHLAGASAWTLPALTLTRSVRAHVKQLKRNNKSAILLWMGGGPATIDLWDLKPGAPTGGPFQPISTSGGGQICEHLPEMAKQMHHMSIIRSMSTREADHTRGRYYMHTGYAPDPNIEHPSYGSVIAHEMAAKTPQLEIPPFVAVGGTPTGPGFLGMAFAPFSVDSNGRVRNLEMDVPAWRLMQRMQLLDSVERRFIDRTRASAGREHAKIIKRTRALMTSQQMAAFKLDRESQATRERYGESAFGRGCLMARRLVEQGVPFIEVDLGGWDTHANNFDRLQTKLPEMDKAMSALVADLHQRGLLQDTLVLWMGEFGRTPRINANGGRDHWARSWSAVVGGAGIDGGKVIGQTSADGTQVESEPFSSQDLMATVCQALGLSLKTTFTSNNGRPMKIANSGKVISDVLA